MNRVEELTNCCRICFTWLCHSVTAPSPKLLPPNLPPSPLISSPSLPPSPWPCLPSLPWPCLQPSAKPCVQPSPRLWPSPRRGRTTGVGVERGMDARVSGRSRESCAGHAVRSPRSAAAQEVGREARVRN